MMILRKAPWMLLFSAVMLAGCTRLVPVADPLHTVAQDKYGTTQRVGTLQVTVRTVGWRADPLYRLEPYVTPLYVQIRNEGNEPVLFSMDDVALVDEEGTLYRPLSPERLEQLLTGSGAASPYPGEPAPAFPYDTDVAATLDSLAGGEVSPGTQVRGAIYFPQLLDRARELTLRLTIAGERRDFTFRVR